MALSGGAWIFLGVVILMLVGLIIGFYTRRGSGVDLHPYRHVHGGAPGADTPAHDAGGSDRTAGGGGGGGKKKGGAERAEGAVPREGGGGESARAGRARLLSLLPHAPTPPAR